MGAVMFVIREFVVISADDERLEALAGSSTVVTGEQDDRHRRTAHSER